MGIFPFLEGSGQTLLWQLGGSIEAAGGKPDSPWLVSRPPEHSGGNLAYASGEVGGRETCQGSCS